MHTLDAPTALRTYIAQQRRITRSGVTGIVFDGAVRTLLQQWPSEWTNEQVLLVRMLLQPQQKQLVEALDSVDLIEELGDPELGEEGRSKLRAWLDPLPQPTKREGVWTVTFYIERGPGMSETWGWRATRLSDEYDLLCEFGTLDQNEPVISDFDYVPLGLVERQHSVRSAALVIAEQRGPNGGSVFVKGEIGCATSISSRLKAVDVYRLMLAYSGIKRVIAMTDDQVIAHEQNGCGMAQVEELKV